MKNRVFIAERGGKYLRAEITDVVKVVWNRIRDDVSECTIDIIFTSEECHYHIAEAEPVRDELVVIRNDGRVWEGPIIYHNLTKGSARLRARDVLFFTQRTVCKRKWQPSSILTSGRVPTVIQRANEIIDTEMRDWERAGINFVDHIVSYTDPGTAKTTRVTEAWSQYVWDDLEAMAARGGLDYTVVNRSLYLHDTHTFIGMGRTLTDHDFLDNLAIIKYGVELAVTSVTTDNLGKHGATSVEDEFYGPVELLAAAYDLNSSTDRITQEELDDQAERNIRSRYPVPAVVRVPEQVQMNPETVDELIDSFLIPGVGFPVRTQVTGKTYESVMKFDQLTVEEDAEGERVKVKISSAPVGSGFEEDVEVT